MSGSLFFFFFPSSFEFWFCFLSIWQGDRAVVSWLQRWMSHPPCLSDACCLSGLTSRASTTSSYQSMRTFWITAFVSPLFSLSVFSHPLCLPWKIWFDMGAVSCYAATCNRCYFKKKAVEGISTLPTLAIYFIYSTTDALKSPKSTHVLPAPLSKHRELSLLIWLSN